MAYYKKALLYNWHYADAMYNLGVAYGEMLKFDMVICVSAYFHLGIKVCPVLTYKIVRSSCQLSDSVE